MNEGLNSDSLRGRYPWRKELAEVLEGHLSIFNGMNSPAFIHDIDGVLVEVNETAVDRLGFDRESLLHKSLFDLDAGILPDHRLRIDDQWFVPESLDNSYYDDAEVLEDKWNYAGMPRSGLQDVWEGVKDEFTFETILERVDGERIPVENTTSLINCGGKRALLTVSREVGIRKDLEHALQEALDKQQILLENVDPQLWYLSDERTYGKVNQSHASFMGRESDEMEGEDLFDLLDEDEAEICLEGNREIFEKGGQI